MANQKRTEVDLKIGAKKYVLQASYEVISSIETHMDMSIMQVLERMSDSALKNTDATKIIYIALQPLHADVFEEGGTFEVESGAAFESALGNALITLTPEKYLPPLMDLLMIAVTGNRVSDTVKKKQVAKK